MSDTPAVFDIDAFDHDLQISELDWTGSDAAKTYAFTYGWVRASEARDLVKEIERLRARVEELESKRITPIRTAEDHKAALARIDALMGAEAGTPEADELSVLADLVEAYEAKHFPIEPPTQAEAVQFRMEQEAKP